MRVLFFADYFVPYIGGQEKAAAVATRGLHARGWDLMVVTGQHNLPLPDEEYWNDIPVYRLAAEAAHQSGDANQWLEVLARLSRLKREFKPDVYDINTFGPLALAHLQTLRAAPAPAVARMHNLFDQPALLFAPDSIVTRAIAHAAWTTAVSEMVLKEAERYLPNLRRASVLYNGVAEPLFEPAPLPQPARLVCLGRLVPVKGLDLALEAFARVHAEEPTARLVFVGDGPEKETLQAQAAALGVGAAVEFKGWVQPAQVYAELNQATVAVLPSRSEGLALAAIEAAFMARPAVATAVGGLPEIVLDGETGLLVPPEDVPRLAAAILELMRSPQRAAKMGEAARAHARRTFSVRRYLDEYDALYRRVAEDAQPARSASESERSA